MGRWEETRDLKASDEEAKGLAAVVVVAWFRLSFMYPTPVREPLGKYQELPPQGGPGSVNTVVHKRS